MTRNLSTAAARRTVISTLATLVLATAFPQASFAYSSLDMWKVDSAKSGITVNGASDSTTLSIKRKGTPETKDPGKLLVIAHGNAYVATGEAAKDALSGKAVDPKRMVQIGSNVRSNDICGVVESLRCIKTVTFTTLGGQQKVIAYAGH